MLKTRYPAGYLKKEEFNSEVSEQLDEVQYTKQLVKQALQQRSNLIRLKRSESDSTIELREPISIFQEIKDPSKKQNLEGLLNKLRSSYSDDLKIGVAVKTGDCFFDSVAQGLNELKGMIKNSERFNVKSLREDCANNANAKEYKDKIIKDAKDYFVPQKNVAFPHLSSIKDEKGNDAKNEQGTLDKYSYYIKNMATENGPIPIWGRPEIEGQMISDKYELELYFYSVNEEGGQKITVTKITPGSDDQEVFIEGVNLDELHKDSNKQVVRIINYKQHFVPLLSGLEEDIKEAIKVSRKEVYGLEDRISPSLIKEDIGNYDLEENINLHNNQAQPIKFDTEADGNCFFHAVFGDNSSGKYKAKKAQDMRMEWHDFLSQFTSLGDSSMPDLLRNQLEKVFDCFLSTPGELTGGSNEITTLAEQTNKKIEEAGRKTKELKEEIVKNFRDDGSFRKVIYPVIQRAINERNIRSLKNQKPLLSVEELLEEKNKERLYDDITEDLKSCALKLNPKLSEEEYGNIYDPTVIKDSFFNDEVLYKAYLTAINNQNYHVFFEEIPILASLANIKISVYHDNGNRFEVFEPNQGLLGGYQSDRVIWGEKGEAVISHEGNHFSYASISHSVHSENRVKKADNEPKPGPSNANQGNQQSPYDGSQSDRDNKPIDSAQHHQINLNSPDLIDSDDEREKNTELFSAIKKGELQKVQKLLETGVKTNIIDKNNKDNTPLHYAVERDKKEIIEELLLPKWKTDINAKNNKGKSPLDIAKNLDKQDIVEILKSHTQPNLQTYVKEQSADQQSFYSKESEDQEKNKPSSNKVKEIAQKRSSKRRTGTASSGDSYEIDLLILGKIRGESDTDRFYLDTNEDGLGAFDDIVFRYWNEEKSTIILLQAKHVENLKKGKVTIEKFTNPKNDKFYLGKYFSDYLNSRKKFNNKSKDPIFQGNFKELDLKYIIYTNSILDEQFDKDRIIDIGKGTFSTKSKEDKGKAFKFSLDNNSLDNKNSDVIKMLGNISCQERVKLLAKAVVSCISGKLNYNNMMGNEFFSTYHVFLAKNVIEVREEIKKDKKKIEYREGKINHNFLNIDNKDRLEKELKEEILYEYGENVVFSKKSSSGLVDRSDLVNKATKSLKSSKKVDEDVIEKLGGSAIILDTGKRKLKFANQEKLEDETAKQFIKDLENKVDNLAGYEFDIPYELVKKTLKEQTKKESLKFPVNFGNINPTFKKPKHLINQLIKLFGEHKSQKVIKIDDDIVGHGKVLTDGDIKNIEKLVGNLLVFDQREEMLRLASEESLNENTLKLIKELKTTAQSKGLEVDSYKFDIKVKNFPRDTLFIDDEDRTNIKEFLSKLEIFTGQASDQELREIIKDEIRNLYNLAEEEVEENFLKVRNKAEEFWKKGDYSLEKDDDFFPNIVKFNIKFDVKEPVASFIGRGKQIGELHTILQSRDEVVISQTTSISGLGGIGKSELARKYISEYSQNYDNNIIWINAESYQTLTESFLRLAHDKLGINVKGIDGNQKDIKSIVANVYEFFSKRKSLFIFDNAEKRRAQDDGDEGIDKFLPSLPSNANKPYILITSRNQSWGNIKKVLSLETFTPEESIEFIKKALKIEGNAQNQGIAKLAETLQNFPLALQQAVAYIKVKDEELRNVGSEFKISDYLERYEKKARELLKFQFPEDSDNIYTKTTFITWECTLDSIKKKENGDKAIEILNIISYFAPENISTQMFLSLVKSQEDLGSAVQLLKQYSMVSSGQEQTTLNVHRLVQQVTRIKLTEQNKAEIIIDKAFNLLNPYDSERPKDYPRKQKLLPHLEAFLSHLDDWLERKPEDKQKIETKYLKSVLIWMGDGYLDSYNPKRTKELVERVLSILKNHYGPEHLVVARTLARLAIAYGHLGEYNEQKELLKRVLPILKNHYGPEHLAVARTLVNLGIAYGDLGDPKKQKELLKEALAIQKKYNGNDLAIANTLVNLGIAYGDLGDPKKQKELVERALSILEKHYDRNHFEIAKTRVNLGNAHGSLGEYNTQKELLERALPIFKEHCGHNNFEVARMLVNLGIAYGGLGDYNKQKELVEQALPILEKHYGPDHVAVATAFKNLQNADKQIELFTQVKKGNLQKVEDYIKKGAVVNAKDKDGWTPLHYAVQNGYNEVVGVLLNKGADVNAKTTDKGNTPLHIAVSKGNDGIIKILLQHASKLNSIKFNDFINAQTTIKGTTALHLAAEKGNLHVVKLLLENGAIVNIKNSVEDTPLQVAESQYEVKKLLNIIEKLFQAVQDEKENEVRSLLQEKNQDDGLKAILNARNTDKKTLLQVASVNEQRRDIALFLLNKLEAVRSPNQQEEATHQEGEISAKKCLPSTSHRKKREAENKCLFTWKDVDEFNVEKDEKRSLSNIEIDSEKFISYVKDLPQEKRDQLIQLADEVKVIGQSQGLINKLISNQKFMNHLSKVGMISGMTMQGMMAKNVLADAVNGNYPGIAINLGFIALPYGVRVGQNTALKGLHSVSEIAYARGFKLAPLVESSLAQSFKVSSSFLARSTSAFIAYDLYRSVKELRNGTKEALVGVVGDSVYLGVDAAELGIEVAEGFGVLEGVSSVTGPIGATIGAVVFVGTDVYQAVKKVENIDRFIHLTAKEKFLEGIRAFIGIKPKQQIEELIEEKQLYNQLVTQALEYLKQHSDVQRYVFPTMKPIVDNAGKMSGKIDLDNVVLFSKKRSDIKLSRARPDEINDGKLFCLPKGNYEQVSSNGSYLCENAMGLEYFKDRTGNYTYISLGNGTDTIVGFPHDNHVVILNNGHKDVTLGDGDDTFVLEGNNITGIIRGGNGTNTLDLEHFAENTSSVNVSLSKLFGYVASDNKLGLGVDGINNLLLRRNKQDYVQTNCDTRYIDGRGGEGKNNMDTIAIAHNSSCSPEIKFVIRPYTKVDNNAENGNFVYIVPSASRGESYVNLKPGTQNIHMFNYTLYDVDSIDVKNATVNFNFMSNINNIRFEPASINRDQNHYTVENNSFNVIINGDSALYQLKDNTEIRVIKNKLFAIQKTNKSVDEIIEYYPLIANSLKMSIFVQSLASNESIAVGHGNHDVLNNNPEYKSHLVGNGGENIFVVTSGYEKLTNKLPIPEVVLYDVDQENKIDTFDLRQITKQVERDLNVKVKTKVIASGKDLLIRLYHEKDKDVLESNIVQVRLKDGLLTNWYERLHVIMNNVAMKIEEFELRPLPLVFDSNEEIIRIAAEDIDKGNKLVISQKVEDYTFSRLRNDLIMTFNQNASLIFSEFYKNKDMETLAIQFTNKEIEIKDELHNVGSFDDLKEEYRNNTANIINSFNSTEAKVESLKSDRVSGRNKRAVESSLKSAASRPALFINAIVNTFTSSMTVAVQGVSEIISAPFKATLPTINHSSSAQSSLQVQRTDINSTLLLLDVFIRRMTGQKYVSTADQCIPLLEAQDYALNITNEFEKVVKQAASKSEISTHRLNINFMKIHDEITEEIIGGKFNEISGILKSHIEKIEKACPNREAGYPGKLSPKKFDKFKDELNKGLDATLKQEILHSRDSKLEVSNVKGSVKPRSDLNNTYIQGHLTQARDVRLG